MRRSRLVSATSPIRMRSSSEIACSRSGRRRHLGDAPLIGVDHRSRGGRLDAVLLRGVPHRIAHVGQRQGQYLAAHRLVQRRQPVELQQADDAAQAQPVDQQREQHETGRQHRDEVLDRRVDALVLGHRQRQRQRDRAAQPAPGDRELVGAADLLAEAQRAEQRQYAEQHGGARQQRRGQRDQQQPHVAQLDRVEQLRHQRRRR